MSTKSAHEVLREGRELIGHVEASHAGEPRSSAQHQGLGPHPGVKEASKRESMVLWRLEPLAEVLESEAANAQVQLKPALAAELTDAGLKETLKQLELLQFALYLWGNYSRCRVHGAMDGGGE